MTRSPGGITHAITMNGLSELPQRNKVGYNSDDGGGGGKLADTTM